MSLSPTSLESQLKLLSPATLGEALTARLETSIHDAETHFVDLELEGLPASHRAAAAALSDELTEALMVALCDVPFPADNKVLLFPKAAPAAAPKSRKGWLAAVASVALLGAALAIWSPIPSSPSNAEAFTKHPHNSSQQFVPTSMGRHIQEARQDGLLGANSEDPHRVLRVVYIDQISMRNADGKTVRVDKPRVEYILVPASLD